MYIGKVASLTGLTIKAIRLYEAKGLITPPKRLGKYRVYEQSHIDALHLIREARLLGISLARLQPVMRVNDKGLDWPQVHRFLQEVRQELETEIKQTQARIKRLDACCQEIGHCALTLP
ncbi:Cu(I)-responsive transcriptional regulator [Bowmanella denitrificans]|uniref:Cu(I)-responsive transcriptional regulator n=1 Tax=Bowmanella denitrificans TaxID=366582 RepID=A0ABN0XXJ5_9ALTE|nr:MerR family transcriptional regulator [Bowmanella denitrificans]